MVGKIDSRFTVELHKLMGNKSVEAVYVDHGATNVNWEWPNQMFPKSFFEEVLPWCASSGFLAQGGVIWLPFQAWFVDHILDCEKRYEGLFRISFAKAKECKEWHRAEEMRTEATSNQHTFVWQSKHCKTDMREKQFS